MSAATEVLHEIVGQLSRLRHLEEHPTVLAVKLINRMSVGKKDEVMSAALLNGRLFIKEAGTDRHKVALHQAVIHAVAAIKQESDAESEKEAHHGISRTDPR